MELFKRIRYQTFTFKLKIREYSELPAYKASMFRGGIGEMLLRKHCLRNRECENCDFCDECVVRGIFYHPMKIRPDFVQGKENTGYIIECNDYKKKYRSGDIITLSVTLFGNVIICFPSLMDAVYMLGQIGVGTGHVCYEVVSIVNSSGETIMENEQVFLFKAAPKTLWDYIEDRLGGFESEREVAYIKMALLSPFTIKKNGEICYEFDGDSLINSIYRRIYLLNCFEGNEIPRYCDNNDGIEVCEQSTKKMTIPRYSSTHNSKLYLTGFSGEMLLKVEKSFLPYLIAGEVLHLGKNVSMGFGKYRLSVV